MQDCLAYQHSDTPANAPNAAKPAVRSWLRFSTSEVQSPIYIHPTIPISYAPCLIPHHLFQHYHPAHQAISLPIAALEAKIDQMYLASQVTYSSSSSKSTSSDPKALSNYGEYSAKSGCYRGFCKICGSFITWRGDETPDEVEILLGTLDEEVLLGEYGALLTHSIYRDRSQLFL